MTNTNSWLNGTSAALGTVRTVYLATQPRFRSVDRLRRAIRRAHDPLFAAVAKSIGVENQPRLILETAARTPVAQA
jgi:hypothetical protein